MIMITYLPDSSWIERVVVQSAWPVYTLTRLSKVCEDSLHLENSNKFRISHQN